MQMFTHPQEGASSCGTDTNQSDQFMQIHILQVKIGNLRGKITKQSKEDMHMHNHHERSEIHAVKFKTNQIR